jgi:hypothetical protein
MIELLLQAERALALGFVDKAEQMYLQAVAADPHNSIAVVGLARVALERGDDPAAWRRAQEALAIDPENVAAQRLAGRLEEVYAFRGESIADLAAAPVPAVPTVPEIVPEEPASPPALDEPSRPNDPPPTRRSLVDRALRRNRP